MAAIVSPEDIGATLESEFGGLDQQDQHIDHFYVKVGYQIADKIKEPLLVPDDTAPGSQRKWLLLRTGLFKGKFPKQSE